MKYIGIYHNDHEFAEVQEVSADSIYHIGQHLEVFEIDMENVGPLIANMREIAAAVKAGCLGQSAISALTWYFGQISEIADPLCCD